MELDRGSHSSLLSPPPGEPVIIMVKYLHSVGKILPNQGAENMIKHLQSD
jgi:hypothetical protein